LTDTVPYYFSIVTIIILFCDLNHPI